MDGTSRRCRRVPSHSGTAAKVDSSGDIEKPLPQAKPSQLSQEGEEVEEEEEEDGCGGGGGGFYRHTENQTIEIQQHLVS
ncbi:hypothetical protein OUZ56_010862 [Daphnia magna]|nr:hypothetical protein OUZ56_010862 [Daphnia magna]